jgi:hypothetical protein
VLDKSSSEENTIANKFAVDQFENVSIFKVLFTLAY